MVDLEENGSNEVNYSINQVQSETGTLQKVSEKVKTSEVLGSAEVSFIK